MQSERIGGLTLAVEAGVGHLQMDYPPLNLVGAELLGDFAQVLPAIAANPEIRVLVLESAVPGVFCLHGDVTTQGAFAQGGPDMVRAVIAQVHQVVGLFTALPQITIAKIAGLCRGGGLELAMTLDLRFAAMGVTRMGQPEVAIGLIPGMGGSTRLPRLLGQARALEVMLGSFDLSAENAERLGLINRALPEGELNAHVDALARHIADLPPHAVAAAKRVVYACPPLDFGPEIENFAIALCHPDTPRYLEGALAAGFQRSLDDEWNMDALCANGMQIARK